MYWPMIISLLILALAYILYRMLPEILDQEMSFLWVIGVFLLLYIGAAIYLSRSLPILGETDTVKTSSAEIIETEIPDVTVR